MARVSGIWKFNDVLVMPSEPIRQAVKFNFQTGSVESGWRTVNSEYLTFNSSSELEYSRIINGTESTTSVHGYSGWRTAIYGERIKTIWFTEEQEVSNEFYAVFTANATQLTTLIDLTGTTWVFDTTKPLNNLLPDGGFAFPIDYTVTSRNDMYLVESHESNGAYFSVGSTYVRVANGDGSRSDVYDTERSYPYWGACGKGLRISIHGGTSATDIVLVQWFGQNAVQISGDDPEDFGDFNFDESLDKNYWWAESLRTVNFTEEQTVSINFYSWLTENAVPMSEDFGNSSIPTVKGPWKFKQELTEHAGLAENVHFTTSNSVLYEGTGYDVTYECWCMVLLSPIRNNQLNYHYTSASPDLYPDGTKAFVVYSTSGSDTTIQAGVYRFNDSMTARGQGDAAGQQIDFYIDYSDPASIGDTIVRLYCSALTYYWFAGTGNIDPYNDIYYYIERVEPSSIDVDGTVYDTAELLGLELHESNLIHRNNWIKSSYQNIIIPENTDAGTIFYEWFTMNTVKISDVEGGGDDSGGGSGDDSGDSGDTPGDSTNSKPIVKGAWKFKPVLIERDYLVESVNFTTYHVVLHEGIGYMLTYECNNILLYPPQYNNQLHYYYTSVNPDFDSGLDSDTGANFAAYSTASGDGNYWVEESLRTINFIGEQEVSDEFYAWLTANADPVTSEVDIPDMSDIGALISYNDKVISAPKAGETITIKCAGMKMEGDIVVYIYDHASSEGV